MSYDISLVDIETRETLRSSTPHNYIGGTYAQSPRYALELNVTYNYAEHYQRVFPGDRGIRTIYGMTGLQSQSVLRAAIDKLGTDTGTSYWEPTEGNARAALWRTYWPTRPSPRMGSGKETDEH